MFTFPQSLWRPSILAPVLVADSGVITTTNPSVTTSAAIPAGSMVVVVGTDSGGGNGIGGVNDGSGNSYASGNNVAAVMDTAHQICWNCAAVPSGQSVAITMAGSTSRRIIIYYVRGMRLTTANDSASALASGTATSPTAATAAPTYGNGIALAAVSIAAARTLVPGTGWTAIVNASNASLSSCYAYQIYRSTASLTWQPTWGGASSTYASRAITQKGI